MELTLFGEETGAHCFPLGPNTRALAGRLLPLGRLTRQGREGEIHPLWASGGGENGGVLVKGELAGGACLRLVGGERQLVGGRQGHSALLWGRPQQTWRGVAPVFIA